MYFLLCLFLLIPHLHLYSSPQPQRQPFHFLWIGIILYSLDVSYNEYYFVCMHF